MQRISKELESALESRDHFLSELDAFRYELNQLTSIEDKLTVPQLELKVKRAKTDKTANDWGDRLVKKLRSKKDYSSLFKQITEKEQELNQTDAYIKRLDSVLTYVQGSGEFGGNSKFVTPDSPVREFHEEHRNLFPIINRRITDSEEKQKEYVGVHTRKYDDVVVKPRFKRLIKYGAIGGGIVTLLAAAGIVSAHFFPRTNLEQYITKTEAAQQYVPIPAQGETIITEKSLDETLKAYVQQSELPTPADKDPSQLATKEDLNNYVQKSELPAPADKDPSQLATKEDLNNYVQESELPNLVTIFVPQVELNYAIPRSLYQAADQTARTNLTNALREQADKNGITGLDSLMADPIKIEVSDTKNEVRIYAKDKTLTTIGYDSEAGIDSVIGTKVSQFETVPFISAYDYTAALSDPVISKKFGEALVGIEIKDRKRSTFKSNDPAKIINFLKEQIEKYGPAQAEFGAFDGKIRLLYDCSRLEKGSDGIPYHTIETPLVKQSGIQNILMAK